MSIITKIWESTTEWLKVSSWSSTWLVEWATNWVAAWSMAWFITQTIDWVGTWVSWWWSTPYDMVDLEVHDKYQDVLVELEQYFQNLDTNTHYDKYNRIITDQRFADFERYGSHKRRNAVTFALDDINHPHSFKSD